jgi:predicted nucleotidyltransferase
MEILFKTTHGSRLYGLAHDDSDWDYFTVVSKVKNRKARYAKQTIIGDEDTNLVDFGTFIDGCVKGVPQYLEAMFAGDEFVQTDNIADLRAGFRTGPTVYDRYLRTIKSFAMSEKDPYKRKRHALRLALNFKQMREFNRFNPTLSKSQVEYISELVRLDAENVYNDALAIAWA